MSSEPTLASRLSLLLLILGFIAALASSAASFWLLDQSRATGLVIDAAHDLTPTITALRVAIAQGDAIERDLALQPQGTTPAALQHAREVVLSRAADLLRLGASQTNETARLSELLTLIGRKLQRWGGFANLQTVPSQADALAIVKDDAAESLSPQIDQRLDYLAADLANSAMEREHRLFDDIRQLFWGSLGATGILLLGGLAYFSTRSRIVDAAYARIEDDHIRYQQLERRLNRVDHSAKIAEEENRKLIQIVSLDMRLPLVKLTDSTAALGSAFQTVRSFMDRLAAEQPEFYQNGAHQVFNQDIPETISRIQSSTARVEYLIQLFTRLAQEAAQPLIARPIVLRELAETLRVRSASRFEHCDIEFVAKQPWPKLVSDPAAIEQILQHLIDNAITYLSPDRPGKIVISGRRRARTIEISVQDNGRGIADDTIPDLFDLSRRIEPTSQLGEGIGLVYCSLLARRLGGMLTCTSQIGQGSVFMLTLPIVPPFQREDEEASSDGLTAPGPDNVSVAAG